MALVVAGGRRLGSLANGPGRTFSATFRPRLMSRARIHLTHPAGAHRRNDLVRPEARTRDDGQMGTWFRTVASAGLVREGRHRKPA